MGETVGPRRAAGQINSQAKGPYPDRNSGKIKTPTKQLLRKEIFQVKRQRCIVFYVSFCWSGKVSYGIKTPLYETHLSIKGKMVPFAGYLMPVQYEHGILAEHKAVREQCGLFDVSHMGGNQFAAVKMLCLISIIC